MRIVDLETKSYSRNPQSSSAATIRRLESRIEELTNQLGQVTKEHHRTSLSRDRDASAQLIESDRQRAKLEEEVRLYEEKVRAMRQQMDYVVSTLTNGVQRLQQTDVHISKRRRASCNWRSGGQNARSRNLGKNL